MSKKNNVLNQYSLFDYMNMGVKTNFSIKKPIRLIEFFSGIGTQFQALHRIGANVESHCISDWDINSNKSYKAMHETLTEKVDDYDYSKDLSQDEVIEKLNNLCLSVNGKDPIDKKFIKRKGEAWQRKTYNEFKANNNLGSITRVHADELNIVDKDKYTYMMFYSFPCLTGDTIVLTKDGYKKIKDIKENEYVLSHTNKYEKVIASKYTGKKLIYKIKGMGIDEIECTANHNFFVRRKKYHYPTYKNGKRGCIRIFEEPKWLSCDKITKDDYLGIAINQNNLIPKWDGVDFIWKDGRKPRKSNILKPLMNNEDFWWIVGRYLGDGWLRTQGGIIVCCAKDELNEIIPHLKQCNFNYSVVEERTVFKIHIPLKELSEFLKVYGKGAKNKHLPGYVFDMPCNLLDNIIKGYISADGYINNKIYKVSSISRDLIYGMAQIVAKTYKTPYRIYKNHRKNECVIEGRVCNQNDGYELVFKKDKCKQDKAFYENGYIWFPIQSIENTHKIKKVYDIEVENSHSFIANGVIVHNCTDLSLAGKQMGMKKGSGTRSGLLWEVERILKETVEHELELPDILMMENVPQVCSGKNKEDFDDWKEFLSSLGYSNFHDILNACDYGVPQNRKRCFMVSILDKNATYTFPKKIPLTRCVKDILEQNVDEKYYINNEKAEGLIKSLLERGVLPNPKDIICVDGTINKPGERNVANCIPARYDSGIGNLRSSGNMVISQRPCIVKDQGKTFGKDIDVASTLLARDYKGLNNRGSNAVIEGKINVVGQLPTGGQRGRVYDSNGILGTLTATEFKDPSKVIEPSIMKYDVETKVKVGKYDLDVNELCNLLRYKRAEKHLTNKEIADALNIPLTKVSHYFRNDRCFAIPDENIWYKLKDLLGIETDKFDKAITEFEIKSSNYDKTNRIYNENGCSPTITSGNPDVKVLVEKNVNQLGNIMDDNGFKNPQCGRVYDSNACSPTLNTCGGGNHEPKIIDATIVAMRGRPIENPNIRQAGLPTKQRLEPNEKGISNTITTVTKDNIVLEKSILTPKRTEFGKEVRKQYENKEVHYKRSEMTSLEPRSDGKSNTLTTVTKDNLVLEPKIDVLGNYMVSNHDVSRVINPNNIAPTVKENHGTVTAVVTSSNIKIDKVGQISSDGSQCGTVVSDKGLFPTVSAGCHGYANPHICTQYRIRKLTPKECGRLMDVTDDVIDAMSTVNSNSKLYQQFGNSIVIAVLCALFLQLNIHGIENWNDRIK